MNAIRGIAAAEGIAIGTALVLPRFSWGDDPETSANVVENPEREVSKLLQTFKEVQQELEALYAQAQAKLGEESAKIVKGQILMAKDQSWIEGMTRLIEEQGMSAVSAAQTKVDELLRLFEATDNAYMRERASDVRDLGSRLLLRLQGGVREEVEGISGPVIWVANDLPPSLTVGIDSTKVMAWVTETGGRTSHSSILARTLGVPAVVGAGDLEEQIRTGQTLIVDGSAGLVYTDPDAELLDEYEEKLRALAAKDNQLVRWKDKPTVTADGKTIVLQANIGHAEEAEAALQQGAEGIGLFRSEFLFMHRNDLPSEEEQFAAYKKATEAMGGKPVTIRTLDIGGDKELPYLQMPRELNPFLGYRAIRLCLDRPHLFLTQLRAILRASNYGQVRLMLPMICAAEEIRQAHRLIEQARMELTQEGIPYDPNMKVGIMVETPAAALLMDRLGAMVDFVSIGTNDLVQYTMACDRMNESISYLYQPYHPSVLRQIHYIAEQAHCNGITVSLCGELGSEASALPLLIGMGVDSISMSASSILAIRETAASLDSGECERLAASVSQCADQEEVLSLLKERPTS
ncbi:phosphoenolpyruvate--protein phosphotransferase [Paenibacillus motobuensis]|uniref:phosphoenolpyruvate--protein phosphotransferase n=1 Tax=Paenibacillus TaxID=44249 RepID=UPI00203ABC4E|nr:MULTISPECIES: phosphoenolpyruvate--protein phosphotransferase [Paenibacillus]MCM3040644.1 phosphoenolpyruvate--protein phosphotransferase [Paenibacillus lutimineralis]MCM3647748.1 phosphoenolpyruvate--protein phosphotransferase [Paenibacillus motobuensis]